MIRFRLCYEYAQPARLEIIEDNRTIIYDDFAIIVDMNLQFSFWHEDDPNVIAYEIPASVLAAIYTLLGVSLK